MCNNMFNLRPHTAIIIDNYMWMTLEVLPCLVRFNLETREYDLARVFPEYEGSLGLSFSAIVEKDGVLFFAPYLSEAIYTYSIAEDLFTKRHEFNPKNNRNMLFKNVHSIGNDICFIPCDFSNMVKLDSETGKIEIESEWREEGENFISYATNKNDKVICAVYNSSNLIECEPVHNKWKRFPIGDGRGNFEQMVVRDDFVFMMETESMSLCKVSLEKHDIRERINIRDLDRDIIIDPAGSVAIQERETGRIYRLNSDLEIIDELDRMTTICENYRSFGAFDEKNNIYYCIGENYLMEMFGNGDIRCDSLQLGDELYEDIVKQMNRHMLVVDENKYYGLKEFCR